MTATVSNAAPAVVAGHLCLDITPAMTTAEPITPGTLIRVGPPRFTTGGAVGNVGLALQRLGTPVRLVACVGDDQFGRTLRSMIEQRGVDARIDTVADQPTSYSIVVSPPGIDRSFLHCPGVNDAFSPDRIIDDALVGARLLHFGYPPAMHATYDDGGEGLADLFQRARRLGLVTTLDTCGFSPASPAAQVDWPAWFDRVLPHVDCFTPSYDELCAMMRREPQATPTRAALQSLADASLDRGCSLAVIKLGDAGLFAAATRDADPLTRIAATWSADAGRTFIEPCFHVDVANTNAAGDSTIAGLIAGILGHRPLPDTLRLATAVGACCVEQPAAAAGIPPLAQIDRRLAAGWVKR